MSSKTKTEDKTVIQRGGYICVSTKTKPTESGSQVIWISDGFKESMDIWMNSSIVGKSCLIYHVSKGLFKEASRGFINIKQDVEYIEDHHTIDEIDYLVSYDEHVDWIYGDAVIKH